MENTNYKDTSYSSRIKLKQIITFFDTSTSTPPICLNSLCSIILKHWSVIIIFMILFGRSIELCSISLCISAQKVELFLFISRIICVCNIILCRISDTVIRYSRHRTATVPPSGFRDTPPVTCEPSSKQSSRRV